MEALKCDTCGQLVNGTDNYCAACGVRLPWGEPAGDLFRAGTRKAEGVVYVGGGPTAREMAVLDQDKHRECPGCHHRLKDCSCGGACERMDGPRMDWFGKAVNVGYMGIVASDRQPTNRDGVPFETDHRIVGMRLVADIDEDGDGCPVAFYDDGWEYQIMSPTDGEYGWVPGGALERLGY